MPIAETSIIAPGQIHAKAPLKKSTVAWAGGILLLLAVTGVALPSVLGPQDSAPKVTPSTTAPPGQTSQIDGEVANAKRRQDLELLNAPAQQPASSASAAKGLPVVPAIAKRDDNSGALYNKKMEEATGTGGGDVEGEAAARRSTSVKADFGDEKTSVLGGSQADAAGRQRADAPVVVAEGERRDDRLGALLDAAKRNDPQPGAGALVDRSWLKELATDSGPTAPLRPYKVTNPYTLLQGKVIPAVLGRDLNTDLPGEVTACTTMDIYDSLSSRHLLIPRGSCLQGRYSNGVKMGQERILFAFTRLTMPNGLSVVLPANPGSDLGGAAGIAGDVNNHFFKMFTSSLLVALLAERVERNKQPAPSASGGAGGANSAAGQVLVEVSRTILDRNRTIPPTITVEKGTRINVEVTRDIEFEKPYAHNKP